MNLNTATTLLTSQAQPCHDMEYDHTALLLQAERHEENVNRDAFNQKALMSKNISDDHFRRANKLEESFLNGVASVCKYKINFIY